MDFISIWGFPIRKALLGKAELDYLSELPRDMPEVQWVWDEMDRIWHQYGLDNTKPLKNQPVGEFYRHPVWLMNGIFTAVDPTSAEHRDAIATYIHSLNPSSVADYGGGFGELALKIMQNVPNATISIIEPYPSAIALDRFQAEPRICFNASLQPAGYDVVIAQDVLEHVEDPLKLASEMAAATRPGGRVIFANCFYPYIQCHLPSTFHLRHSFTTIMKALGLRYIGNVDGVVHSQIFVRSGRINMPLARVLEVFSRLLMWLLNMTRPLRTRLNKLLRRT